MADALYSRYILHKSLSFFFQNFYASFKNSAH